MSKTLRKSRPRPTSLEPLALVINYFTKTVLTQEFEAKRQDRIKETSELRINVDSRFQKVIDRFLVQLN